MRYHSINAPIVDVSLLNDAIDLLTHALVLSVIEIFNRVNCFVAVVTCGEDEPIARVVGVVVMTDVGGCVCIGISLLAGTAPCFGEEVVVNVVGEAAGTIVAFA